VIVVLTPSEKLFSFIMVRTSYNDGDVSFVLDQRA